MINCVKMKSPIFIFFISVAIYVAPSASQLPLTPGTTIPTPVKSPPPPLTSTTAPPPPIQNAQQPMTPSSTQIPPTAPSFTQSSPPAPQSNKVPPSVTPSTPVTSPTTLSNQVLPPPSPPPPPPNQVPSPASSSSQVPLASAATIPTSVQPLLPALTPNPVPLPLLPNAQPSSNSSPLSPQQTSQPSPLVSPFSSQVPSAAPSSGQMSLAPAAPIPISFPPSLTPLTPNTIAPFPLPNAQPTSNALAPSPQQTAQPTPNPFGQAITVPPATATGLSSLTPEEQNAYQYLMGRMNQGSGVQNYPIPSPTSFLRNTPSLLTSGVRNFVSNYDYPIRRDFRNGLGLFEKQLGANLGFLGAHAQNLGNTLSGVNRQVQRGYEALPFGVGTIPAQAIGEVRQFQVPERLGSFAGSIVGSIGQALDNRGTTQIYQNELSHAQASLQRKANKIDQIRAKIQARAQTRARQF